MVQYRLDLNNTAVDALSHRLDLNVAKKNNIYFSD